MSPGAWAWVVQRATSIVLVLAMPLKILSGYAAVGKIGLPGLAPLHRSAWLDVVIMVSLIFHAVYGLRVILVEHGLASRATWLFHVLTAVGVLLSVAAVTLVW